MDRNWTLKRLNEREKLYEPTKNLAWTIQVKLRVFGLDLPECDVTAGIGVLMIAVVFLSLIYGGT